MNPESDHVAGGAPADTGSIKELLRRLLGELEGLERRAVVGGASRRLIQHGRSLDALLWQAHRLWKEYNRHTDPATLDALSDTLMRAHTEAEQLKVALLVSTAPLSAAPDVSLQQTEPRFGEHIPQGAPPHGPPEEVGREFGEVRRQIRDLLDALEPRSSGGVSAAGSAPGTQPEERVPQPEEEEALRAGSAALESLLWRITADWQHLQRSPSPDRIGVLCDELERAADQVRQLADSIGQVAPRRDRRPAAAPAAPAHAPFRDALTGALNREGFDSLVIGELKRSRRYRRPFTLLLLEMRESDSRALTAALDRLTAGLRGSDFIGRYVDRLIAIGLPETSSEAALAATRRVVRSLPTGPAGRAAPRLGLASLPEDGRTLAELVALARRQLNEGPVSLGEMGMDYWGV